MSLECESFIWNKKSGQLLTVESEMGIIKWLFDVDYDVGALASLEWMALASFEWMALASFEWMALASFTRPATTRT